TEEGSPDRHLLLSPVSLPTCLQEQGGKATHPHFEYVLGGDLEMERQEGPLLIADDT
ncbi:hypothetical protein P7K49_013317, partial [Saguinus oedipus]